MLRSLLFVGILAGLVACGSPASHPAEAGQEVWPDSLYLARGQQLVRATADSLIHTLVEAIATQGTAGALAYCNLQAIPITQARAAIEGVSIRRAALRYRNPANAADSLERQLLAEYAGLIIPGQAPPPPRLVRGPAEEVHFFSPILLQPFCGQCHGQPGVDISDEVQAILQQRYPEDLATGFAAGDLRGLWHVTFRPK